jgi:NADH dehydrogenase
MATIGRKNAVADAFGLQVTGRTAMLLWAVVHIAYLVGWGNRVGTVARWMWTLATRSRRERLISAAPALPPSNRDR